ncbi:UNVERIFIED_CONTAM: hypothetical protein Slati_1908600 [Sesamum latifolium]|uniref:Endonuclease/exonuclease/phosphatase domain-containing protein n=1 Tax=Sesamum latifolium TaxID=2727402 RepID=A0AAW2X0S3_9LAMI
MKIICWNCQGLGPPWTVCTLNELIRLYDPGLVFLSETKCRNRKCEYLKEKYNMYGINVDARGKSGGLILLWRKDVNLVIQSFSSSHIDTSIVSEIGEAGWRFTGIYGQPDAARRGETWQLLKHLSRLSSRSWVCAGDFNEIMCQEEKSGKIMRPWRHIEAFRECMTDCNLTDLGFQGHLFTWCNMREPPKTVNARLDRPVATPDWRLRFPHACVTHLPRRGLDHCPLLLQLEPGPNVDRKGPKKFFRFEAMWSRASDCEDVIRKFWSGGDDSCAGERVWQRLQAVRGGLNDWDKTCFGHVGRRIQELEKKLESKSGEPASGANWAEYRRDKKELEELLNREETM